MLITNLPDYSKPNFDKTSTRSNSSKGTDDKMEKSMNITKSETSTQN